MSLWFDGLPSLDIAPYHGFNYNIRFAAGYMNWERRLLELWGQS